MMHDTPPRMTTRIRAKYTSTETGWVEPVAGGYRILNVPWTTADFGYGDVVGLDRIPKKLLPLPSVVRVVFPSGLNSFVVRFTPKKKNIRRVVTALEAADPDVRISNLMYSYECRIATRLSAEELAQRLKLPFRVDILPFFPGKIG